MTGNSSSTGDWNAIQTCSVNSVSASVALISGDSTSYSDGLDRSSAAIFYATGLSGGGTTLDITVVANSSDVFRSWATAHRIDSDDLYLITTNSISSLNTASISLDIDIPSDNICFAMLNSIADAGTPTFSGSITEDETFVTEAYLRGLVGHQIGGGPSFTVEATSLTSPNSNRLLAATFSRNAPPPSSEWTDPDLANASYDGVSFSVGSQATVPTGLFFKSDGSKMYITNNTTDRVYQYSTD